MVDDHPQHPAEAAEILQPPHDQVVRNLPPLHDQVVLSITDCLPNIRSMKQSVAADLTNLHERIKFLANLQAARIEAVETSIRETNARLAVLEQRETSETPRQRQEQVGFRTPLQGELPNPLHRRDQDPELFQPLEDDIPAVPADESRDPVAPTAAIKPPAPLLPTNVGTPQTVRQRAPRVLVLGHKMPTTIPVFLGGTNENFATFTRCLSDHVNAAKHTLDDNAKRAVFLTYLSDYARDKAEELLEMSPKSTFEDLVAAMKKTFEDPIRAERERQQLRQCVQRSEETVDQYGERVRKLAQSAYAGRSRDFIHDKARKAFLEGLLSNLKFHVKGEIPKSFTEAQHSAAKFEMLLAEAARANIKKSRDPVQSLQFQSQPAVQSIQAAPQISVAQLEALQADNAAKQQQITALIERNNELATAAISSSSGPGPATSLSSLHPTGPSPVTDFTPLLLKGPSPASDPSPPLPTGPRPDTNLSPLPGLSPAIHFSFQINASIEPQLLPGPSPASNSFFFRKL